MKNDRLFANKKKSTKIWITLAVLFTIFIGASLGTLSAYNWSLEQAVQGLFSTNQEEQPERIEEDELTANQEEPNEDPAEPVEEPANTDQQPSEDEIEDPPAIAPDPPLTPETVTEPIFVDDVLIVNKQYPLPSTYAPGEDEEARAAYNEMEQAALTAGHELIAFSTYRSYDYQIELYNRYVDQHGQEEADRFSARPGYSEHQTGLGFDIGEVDQEVHWASDSFKETEAAIWLAENAHEFGFILRYPPGKEHITGYQYESWHFRYLGKELATEVYESELTLEEYLNI